MKLKAYLKWSGLSSHEFARRVCTSHTTINNLANGKHKPRRGLMGRIIFATAGKVGLAAFDLHKNYLNRGV